MALQVRPDYVNPLTTIKENKNDSIKKHAGNMKDDKSDELTELRTKQQTLQNELILLKTTGSDSTGSSSEKLEALQKKLEEVSSDLRTAKNNSSGSTEKATLSKAGKTEKTNSYPENKSSVLVLKPDFDTYEKEAKDSEHPGIYHPESNSNNGYQVSFSPYTETE